MPAPTSSRRPARAVRRSRTQLVAVLGAALAVALVPVTAPAVAGPGAAAPAERRPAGTGATPAGQSHVVAETPQQITGTAPAGSSSSSSLRTPAGESRASNAVTGAGFSAVTPFRVLDTRPGEPVAPGGSAPGARLGQGTLTVDPRIQGVPADATAVVLNVTGIDASRATFLTAFPSGTTRPGASNLNLPSGSVTPNSVTVRLGADGRFALYNDVGTVHVAADVTGYYRNGTGEELTALTPARIVDTRPGSGNVGAPPAKLGAGQTGTYSVPGATAATTAVVLNLTGIAPSTSTYLSVFPAGAARPVVSALNLGPGRVAANLVIVGVTNGRFSIYNDQGVTDLAVDLVGRFAEDGNRPGFVAQSPVRLADTRTGVGTLEVRLPARSAITVKVAPAGSAAVTLNVTGVAPTAGTFLTVYPTGAARPNTSSLNLRPGEVRPNSVVSAVDSRGAVTLYNDSGSIHVIVDVLGVFGTGVSTVPLREARGVPGDFETFGTADNFLIHWYCQNLPITYAINPTYAAGPDAVADVVDAVARVSLASGLVFQRVANTSAIPQESWLTSWPAGQAEMVIAFANPPGVGPGASRSDFLPGGGVVGVGGWSRVNDEITRGFAVVDASAPITAQPGFGGNKRGTVVEHEITHAVGLGHASDNGQQVMAPFSGPPGSFGRGDIAGLVEVGC